MLLNVVILNLFLYIGFGYYFVRYLDDVGFIVYVGVLYKDSVGVKKLKFYSFKRLYVF